MEDSIMDEKKFELIIAFVNSGFTDLVMDSAREHGARGGTVLHARGTGNKEIEEKYNISISTDKEMVMIVVESTAKDEILKAINEAVGFQTDGHGIAFSVPIDDVVGLKFE